MASRNSTYRRGKATYLKGMEEAAVIAEANPDRAAEAIRQAVESTRKEARDGMNPAGAVAMAEEAIHQATDRFAALCQKENEA